jgi:putative transposase
VTCCTQNRRPGLTNPVVAGSLRTLVADLDSAHDTATIAFTVMPDHVHWLFTLGSRLSLGRVMARWKVQSRSVLAGTGLAWQRDFFEHALRDEESSEDYGLYVFLNPYRAGLLPATAKWPHWVAPHPEDFGFVGLLNPDGTPPSEWIADRVPADLAIGE